MNVLGTVSELLLDLVLAATALMLLYRACRWLWESLGVRWATPAVVPVDPAAAAVWEVLAEARAILDGEN